MWVLRKDFYFNDSLCVRYKSIYGNPFTFLQ